jgi:3-phenylpropionate/cinnamic acid dioxygenase small subunit
MAEASLLSQKAAMLEQDNFKAILDLQREEAALSKVQKMEESKLNMEERRSTAHLLQKMVERLRKRILQTDMQLGSRS